MPPKSPTLAGVEFAIRVRTRRRELGLAAETICKALDVSRVYYSAIENHRANLSQAKLPVLLETLGYVGDESDEMTDLLRDASGSGWWGQYSDRAMSEDFAEFVGLEYGAKRARIYESRLMTGLLQTRAYASEVVRAAPEVSLADLSKVVDIRMRRQDRVGGDDPLRLEIILSQAVLMQQFGGPEILRDQLQDLVTKLEVSSWLEVRIQPFDQTPVGLTSASTLVLLDFESPHMPTAAWREAGEHLGVTYDQDVVASLALRFEQALQPTLDPDDSLDLIRSRLDELAI